MLAMIWNNGPWEWIIILIVVLIFFGAGKLPQVLKQMGLGVKAFKDGMDGDEGEKNVDYESAPEQIAANSSLDSDISADTEPAQVIDAEELEG